MSEEIIDLPTNEAYKELLVETEALLEKYRGLKTGRTEKDRHLAICITKLEDVRARVIADVLS